MILDLNSLHQGQVLRSDVCVIGGGPAGISLARELASRNIGVCVLESGGLEVEAKTQALKTGEVSGQPKSNRWSGLHLEYEDPNQYLLTSRLRTLGGSTQHWGGYCLPMGDHDFLARSWIPLSGWPFKRDEIAPYYPRAAELCQVCIPELSGKKSELSNRTLEEGRDGTLKTRLIHIGPPTKFGDAYRDDLESRGNVKVLLHANVTELKPDPTGRRLEEIHAQSLDGKRVSVRARCYVLAAGGLENARILLASNSVHRNGIGNDHDLVGRYFMEHPQVEIGQFVIFRNPSQLAVYGIHDEPNLSTGSANPGLSRQIVGILAPDAAIFENERIGGFSAQMMLWNDLPADAGRLGRSLLFSRAESEGLTSNDVSFGAFYVRSEQLPNPENRVTLTDDRDPLGMRRLKLTWQLFPPDVDTIVKSTKVLAREFGRSGWGRVRMMGEEQLRAASKDNATRWGPRECTTTRNSGWSIAIAWSME